jgi:GAF domain-containing protein
MLEHTPNAFYALDNNLCFLYANRRIQELMNLPEDGLIGKCLRDLRPASIGSTLFQLMEHALATGETGHLEEYFPPLNKWFEVYIYPSDYGLAIYVNDITGRKKSEQQLHILNQAGFILATDHDITSALNRISDLVVPAFSDWFTIDHLKDDSVSVLAMGHTDPQNLRWGLEYRSRTEIDLEKPKPGSVGWVIRIGTPVCFNGVTDDQIRAAAADEEHYAVLKRLNIKSSIIVPMPMRGRTIGALTFISSQPGKVYDEADLHFASDLAIRVGLTIENSRLFDEMKKDLAQKIRMNSLSLEGTAGNITDPV